MRARSLDRLKRRSVSRRLLRRLNHLQLSHLLVGCSLVWGSARPAFAQQTTAPTSRAAALQAEPLVRAPLLPVPLPHLAALVPGLFAHGTGPWLLGKSEVGRRLFWLQGASMLLFLGGATLIASTGASKYTVGPGALIAANGLTLLGTSLLSGLYSTFAPPEGFGQAPARLPLLETQMGYMRVADSQFAYRDFLVTSVDAYPQRWHLAVRGDFAPNQKNQRWQAVVGRRVWGVSGQGQHEDGSYLELQAGYTRHQFSSEQFISRTSEVLAEGRLDLHRYLPEVRGAFLQSAAGYARQQIFYERLDDSAATDTNVLLMHMGFGLYFGNRSRDALGGEVEGYYDHRHDGFVGGLKFLGIGSGALGHFGMRAKFRASPTWGVSFQSEAGAAWTWTTNLVMRTGS